MSYFFSFIVEEWGACSSPCGEGIRERKVECKIFLEFSKTIATLPDHECPGPKPATTEICFSGLCQAGVDGLIGAPEMPITSALISSQVHNVQKDDGIVLTPHRLEMAENSLESLDQKPVTYQWKDVGFTACSESCLGGLQESKIICVNERDDAVSPMHCDMSERPDVIVQTCNDHPCPPRFGFIDYSNLTPLLSKSNGIMHSGLFCHFLLAFSFLMTKDSLIAGGTCLNFRAVLKPAEEAFKPAV